MSGIDPLKIEIYYWGSNILLHPQIGNFDIYMYIYIYYWGKWLETEELGVPHFQTKPHNSTLMNEMIYRCIHGSTYWSTDRSTCQDQKSAENINPCNFLQNEWHVWHEIPRMDEHMVYIQMEVSWNGGTPPVLIFFIFGFSMLFHPSYWGSPVQVDEHVGLGQRSLLHAGGWGAILGRLLLWCFRPWVPRFWGWWRLCHVSKPEIYMDLAQIIRRLLREKGVKNHWILVGHFEPTPDQSQIYQA